MNLYNRIDTLVLPHVIKSLEKKSDYHTQNHFSLNLFTDGSLVLLNYSELLSSCKTNQSYINDILYQVDFVNYGSGFVRNKRNGCKCTQFQMLTDAQLPENWVYKVIEKPVKREHFFRST